MHLPTLEKKVTTVSGLYIVFTVYNIALNIFYEFQCVRRVSLTVSVVRRARRPRGLAQACRRMRRSPLLPCCQE